MRVYQKVLAGIFFFKAVYFFILFPLPGKAQPQIAFRTYTVEDGLSHNLTKRVFQDSEGFIWIATEDGLNRFDSHSFKVYQHIAGDSTSLSNNVIVDITEDEHQNLWIGTWGGGICIYDRTTDRFKRITKSNHVEDSAAFPIDYIADVFTDAQNRIWIGTANQGLLLADVENHTFTKYQHQPGNPNSLSNDWVDNITEEKSGKLWIATFGGGLNYFDPATGTFEHFNHNPKDKNTISNDNVSGLCYDSRGRLWIGSWDGLTLMTGNPGQFVRFRHQAGDPMSLASNQVWTINEDAQGRIWIGTDAGLALYNEEQQNFYTYQHKQYDPKSIGGNSVKYVYTDHQERLWVTTFNGGISMFDENFVQFRHYYPLPSPNTLSHPDVSATLQTREGQLLIATDGGGLNIFHRDRNYFEHFQHREGDSRSISNNKVKAIFQDSKGSIWIGFWEGGLDQFDPETKTFIHHKFQDNNPKGPNSNSILGITEDKKGNLWLATFGGGINKFDPETGVFTYFTQLSGNPSSLKDKLFWCVLITSEGNLIAGPNSGLLHFLNTETYEIATLDIQEAGRGGFPILVLYQDRKERIWIGTEGGGLLSLNPQTQKLEAITTADGLASNNINGIAEDAQGCIWLSTNYGISQYCPDDKIIKNYDTSYGLQGLQFNRQTFAKLSSGELMVGGANGLNIFNPDSIYEYRQEFPIVFTDFQIFNQPVPIGTEDSPLQAVINQTDTITLSYKHSVFSLSYTGLNYTNPTKTRYKYRLQGFVDESWQKAGNENKVTYTNLPPEKYIFSVTIDENDPAIIQPIRTLTIIILPPWWQTWWFRVLAVLAVSSLAFTFYKVRIRGVRKQNKKLETLVSERTKELSTANVLLKRKNKLIQEQNEEIQAQAEELEEFNEEMHSINQKLEERVEIRTSELKKSNQELDNFVYRVSHDIRAPLSSTMGLIELLEIEKDPASAAKYLTLANQSLQKLDKFVRDILDYSRNARMEINKEVIDFGQLLESTVAELQYMDKADRIALQTTFHTSGTFYSDPKRLQIIFRNLISNAIKYQNPYQSKSFLKIAVDQQPEGATLLFEDNGIGIASELTDKVFNMFFKASERSVGSGIGLYIVKETVEKLRGQIEINSALGEGTRFRVFIPNHNY